tara:strand:+ start:1004 stop:1642 length:639 start_codon:yes stop_codon:yes gene_type:complete
MTFEIGWWWRYQDKINEQFSFSKVREDVASRLVSRLNFTNTSIKSSFENRDLVIVGAAITESSIIPSKNLVVADGALRACLEREIVPEWIISDLDGYLPDIIWSSHNGSNVIVHAHGDNISRVSQYYNQINPTCITTTYPSPHTSCWGGFTDGDRSVMMCLSLGCKSIKLLGYNFENIGSFSGEYSPRKLEKLKWAERIINECKSRSSLIMC